MSRLRSTINAELETPNSLKSIALHVIPSPNRLFVAFQLQGIPDGYEIEVNAAELIAAINLATGNDPVIFGNN